MILGVVSVGQLVAVADGAVLGNVEFVHFTSRHLCLFLLCYDYFASILVLQSS